MTENQNLTDNFSLWELTKTSNNKFQDENRAVTPEQIKKLTEVARLLEHVRFVLQTPLIVTSAYRCPGLNSSLGSTDKSQHLKCEAADIIPVGQEINVAFRSIWRDLKDNSTNIGQLIHETDNGKNWIHISLGSPYRSDDQCKQILRAHRSEDGKMLYTRIA